MHDPPEEAVRVVQLLVRPLQEELQRVPPRFDREEVLPWELGDGDVAERFRQVHVVVPGVAEDQEEEPAGVGEGEEVGLHGAEFGGEGRVEEP